ncbi:MAG: hypothetical protein Q8Q73_18370 [Stagnimonas sp.]|nr:hypothetical protein [Stagnimonas sp.]
MNIDTSAQFSAVYAEAAIAWIETALPQAVLWYEDEQRWDFTPGDEELTPSLVAFLLSEGWDSQLSLEACTDPDDDRYDSRALRDEIEQQMEEEGVARALIAALIERRDNLGEDEELPGLPDEDADER